MDFLFCFVLFAVCEERQYFLAVELLMPGDGAVAHVGS